LEANAEERHSTHSSVLRQLALAPEADDDVRILAVRVQIAKLEVPLLALA
jgi:hypothetical protein